MIIWRQPAEIPGVEGPPRAKAVLKNQRKSTQATAGQKENPGRDRRRRSFEELRPAPGDRRKGKGPPYVVFADSTLREMCELLPTTKEAMLAVKGVGEVKFKKYGREFLERIKEFCEKDAKKNRD